MTIPRYSLVYRGKNFLADSKEGMIDNIVKYYTKQKEQIDVIEIGVYVDKNIKGNPSSAPDTGGKLNKVHVKKLSFKEAMAGAAAVLKVVGGESVSPEEVKRRSNICEGCPLRSKTTDCYGCGFGRWLSKWARTLRTMFTGQEFSISTEVVGSYCSVCGCALSVMVPSKMSQFHETEAKQAERPSYCWAKKGSVNFIP